MRNRFFILLTAMLVIVFVGVAGVFAYDRTGRGTIADGVSIAGIDIGGMSAEEARAALERTYVAELRKPITITDGAQTFTLDATESQAAAKISTLVDQALAQGKGDSMITRSWRRLTGSDLDRDLAPSTVYDTEAASQLVTEIRSAIDRPARDATATFKPTGIESNPGSDGVEVRTAALERQLRTTIVDPRAPRDFSVPVRRTRPNVRTAEIKAKYRTALIVNRERFTLTLYKKLRKVKTYHVAVGAVGLETPAGMYAIQNKAINPAWTKPHSAWVKPSERGDIVPGGTPQNPLKARWLGIFDGAGIHGIDPSQYGSIGHAASHGCIRMRIPDVIELYDKVPLDTPIYIG